MLKSTITLLTLLLSSSLFAQPAMIDVEGGTFEMGGKPGIDDVNGDPIYTSMSPLHTVTVSSFRIGKYEVSQGEWMAVMGDNPSHFSACGLTCPVEEVDWYSMIVYCNALSVFYGKEPVYYKDADHVTTWVLEDYDLGGNTNAEAVYWDRSRNGFRIPTEAEWEYAARGGNISKGYKYSGSNTIGDVAWYYDSSGNTTHDRTTNPKQPNELGIYDMSGNVFEWVWDWYGSYPADPQCNPTGPVGGAHRVGRGGSWSFVATYCRSAIRFNFIPDNPDTGQWNGFGFRLAAPQ